MDSATSGMTAVDAKPTGMGGRPGTLRVSVDGMDAGDDAMAMRAPAAVYSRPDDANTRINDAFDRLSNIEAALQIANRKTDRPTAVAPPPTNALLDGESELNVDAYHCVKHGDAATNGGPAYCEPDMAFSCNKNVFPDAVDLMPVQNIGDHLDHVVGDTATAGSPSSTTNNNYVKVDNRDLYNNRFNTGSGQAVLDVPVNFNNKLLRADETLRFTGVLYDGVFANVSTGGNIDCYGQLHDPTSDGQNHDALPNQYFEALIEGSTRDDNVGLYEINVEWVASGTGVTCQLNFGGAGIAPGLTVSQTLTYGVTTDKDDADDALKAYKDTIDCSGDPVRIN